jgi:hypothetical protein
MGKDLNMKVFMTGWKQPRHALLRRSPTKGGHA